jgi:hypothetical protein
MDFGECCCIILAFFAPGNDVYETLSSLKTDVLLWNEKKGSLFCDFWHIKMILHNRTLQRPFSKLKKHHPTNLYMLYPMVQSVDRFHVEIKKKMLPQWHCPLPSSSYPKTKSRSII